MRKLIIGCSILLGFLVAVAVYQQIKINRINQEIERLDQALSDNLTIYPTRLIELAGIDEARSVLSELAARYPDLMFDGRIRLCQVHRDGMRYEAGESSDKLLLTAIGPPGDPDASFSWYGPPGFTIDSFSFTPNGVNVKSHIENKEEKAIVCEEKIPWPAGSEPDSGIFTCDALTDSEE